MAEPKTSTDVGTVLPPLPADEPKIVVTMAATPTAVILPVVAPVLTAPHNMQSSEIL